MDFIITITPIIIGINGIILIAQTVMDMKKERNKEEQVRQEIKDKWKELV